MPVLKLCLFVYFKLEVSNFLFVFWVSSSKILATFQAKLLASLLLNEYITQLSLAHRDQNFALLKK